MFQIAKMYMQKKAKILFKKKQAKKKVAKKKVAKLVDILDNSKHFPNFRQNFNFLGFFENFLVLSYVFFNIMLFGLEI